MCYNIGIEREETKMAYGSYDYFTRKQCNLLFKAFKRGQLTPPKDCRGKVKRAGFVYRFEGQTRYCGWHLTPEQNLINCQLAALRETIGRLCSGDVEGAQKVLDGEDEGFNWGHLPNGVEPRKMWRAV